MCFNFQMKIQKGEQRKLRKKKRGRNADRQFFFNFLEKLKCV